MEGRMYGTSLFVSSQKTVGVSTQFSNTSSAVSRDSDSGIAGIRHSVAPQEKRTSLSRRDKKEFLLAEPSLFM